MLETLENRSFEPNFDCSLCPRLVAFRRNNCRDYPDFYNAPVPDFGSIDASLLIVGLAPGLNGANRTGKPFTGDGAGRILYPSLIANSFALGHYVEERDNGLVLDNCRITNAVKCLPPQNKPLACEINTCRAYLLALIEGMGNLRVILSLGRVAHESVLRALGVKLKDFPFKHGARYSIGEIILFDSYHCSRYNISTKRLTYEMFDNIVGEIRELLGS